MDQSIETIRRFPTLAAALAKLPEAPVDLIGWLKGQTNSNDEHGLRIGRARRCSARLLLHLWGENPTFDLRTALEAWDQEHLGVARELLFPTKLADTTLDDLAVGCLTVP